MSTNVIQAQRFVPSVPHFATVSSSLARVNWVFSLYVAAGVAYCLYNVYKVYQYTYHAYSLLDDKHKLIKCKALLEEARERPGDAKPLLQECEALLASISKKMYSEKKEIQLKLVQHYVEIDPDRSCEIVQTLTFGDLFDTAQAIQKAHPDFDHDKLSALYSRVFRECLNKDVAGILELAKAFHSLQKNDLKDQALKRAWERQNGDTNALRKVRSLCEMAKCYKEVGVISSFIDSIEKEVRTACNTIESPSDKICAHLNLAHTFFSMKAYDKMDQELIVVEPLFKASDALLGGLISYTKLLKMISSSHGLESEFSSCSKKLYIETAFDYVNSSNPDEWTPKSRAEAYLTIAKAWQEIDDHKSAQQAAGYAFEEIKKLPADIEPRQELLRQVIGFFKKVPNQAAEMMQLLESLYDESPYDSSGENNKRQIGRSILSLYNKMEFSEASTAFFNKFLSDIRNNNKEVAPFAIIDLTRPVRLLKDDTDLSLEQRIALLEAAEQLIPQVPFSDHTQMMRLIADGYIKADRLKTFEILKNYENSQSKHHLVNAAAMAIAMGILFVSPSTSLFLSAGLAAYSFIRQL